MVSALEGKLIALGVSGSIACYKAVDLASKMRQQGALVDVIMTRSATRFVAPLAFAAITHRPVVVDPFDPRTELGIDHVAIAERADAVIIAPATANTLAKLAWGMADDALSATVLATRAPVIAAPAMDANMYLNAATRENVERLAARGVVIAGPAHGRLASGLVGPGRLLETPQLLGYLAMVLGRTGDLAGPQDRSQRRGNAGAGGPRARNHQPVVREDGLRHRRGRPGPGSEGGAGVGAHVPGRAGGRPGDPHGDGPGDAGGGAGRLG